MTEAEQHRAPLHKAIADYTERQLQRPPEELRAEIEASLAEIRAGWLGISDFMARRQHLFNEAKGG